MQLLQKLQARTVLEVIIVVLLVYVLLTRGSGGPESPPAVRVEPTRSATQDLEIVQAHIASIMAQRQGGTAAPTLAPTAAPTSAAVRPPQLSGVRRVEIDYDHVVNPLEFDKIARAGEGVSDKVMTCICLVVCLSFCLSVCDCMAVSVCIVVTCVCVCVCVCVSVCMCVCLLESTLNIGRTLLLLICHSFSQVSYHTYQNMYGIFLLPMAQAAVRQKKKLKFLEIGLGCHAGYFGKSVPIWLRMFSGGLHAELWEAEHDSSTEIYGRVNGCESEMCGYAGRREHVRRIAATCQGEKERQEV
jgi:hypothetical protein